MSSTALPDLFRYRVNYFCIFEYENFYTLLFMGLCLIEMCILLAMLQRAIEKKHKIVDPDIHLGEY